MFPQSHYAFDICKKYGPSYLHDSDHDLDTSSEDSFDYKVLQDNENEAMEELDESYFSDMNDNDQD